MKKKVLYLLHINWFWIKQRPQIIAEGLSKKYDVTVMYKHSYVKNGFQKKSQNKVKLEEIYTLPHKFERAFFYNWINDRIIKSHINKFIKQNNPSVIYVTSPMFFNSIPRNFDGKIIYDCMDDHIEFLSDLNQKKTMYRLEKSIIECADKVIVSSSHLKKELLNRYGDGISKKLYLVRNGFVGPVIDLKLESNKYNPQNVISYFGTISKWFDFEVLKQSLIDFPNIQYELWGPVDKNVIVPQDARIKIMGIAEHDDLYRVVKKSKVLIMPFKVNKLIESVDPVKLYEYINFGKNIITIKYPEIERFENFVYFYNNYRQFREQLNIALNSNKVKYNNLQRVKFLNKNNWRQRVNKIINVIEDEN